MIRLAVRCAPEYAEAVMGNLLELAPNGLEEERGPGWVEFAIYGPPGEVPDLGELQAAAGEAWWTSRPPRFRMTGRTSGPTFTARSRSRGVSESAHRGGIRRMD